MLYFRALNKDLIILLDNNKRVISIIKNSKYY